LNLNQNLPLWKSKPRWLAAPIAGGGSTVGDYVTSLEQFLRNLGAIQGLPDDVCAPLWSLNMVTNYSFAPEGWVEKR
jgi:hypothetical protein